AMIGEELAEGGERRRREAAGGQVVQRSAEVGITVRPEQQVQHPARGAVLADLLREGVLVEVDEDQDAVPSALGDDGRDAVEVVALEPSGLALERAPVDREAAQVEAESGH